MVATGFPSTGRKLLRRLAWLSVFGWAALAWAQDLTFSAKVDKTAVDLLDPITLTITIGGDASGVEVPTPEFPEGFAVAGRSQSTNFAIHAGATERSTSLAYVLVPQRAGTFQLGPFSIKHRDREFKTQPIQITVKKPVLPPQLQPQGGRFTL